MKDILLRSNSVNQNGRRPQVPPDSSLPPLRFKDSPARVRDAEKTDLQVSIGHPSY